MLKNNVKIKSSFQKTILSWEFFETDDTEKT